MRNNEVDQSELDIDVEAAESAHLTHTAYVLLNNPESFKPEHRVEHLAKVSEFLTRKNPSGLSLDDLRAAAQEAADYRPQFYEEVTKQRSDLVVAARANLKEGDLLSREAAEELAAALARSMKDEKEAIAILDEAELAYHEAEVLSRLNPGFVSSVPKLPYEKPEIRELEGEERDRAAAAFHGDVHSDEGMGP